ncbi:MAG: M48 family metallopeptidase [Proteobacteria bacterium]|nr:M48 family metallopeptidase [Pseudomonadota bacterium]
MRLLPGGLVEVAGRPVRLRVNARARRLTLRVDGATGEVSVTAPSARRLPEAAEFARRRSDWIAEKTAERPAGRPFRAGAVIPLRGQPVRLEAVPGRGAARLKDGVVVSGGEGEAFERRVLNLLRREALADLTARTAVHAAALGVPMPRIILNDPRGRWGSCTPGRSTIRYSWRVIGAPPFVLDYLAAHEVAHLKEANHGPGFWALVERLFGDPRSAREWLRAQGSALHALGRD